MIPSSRHGRFTVSSFARIATVTVMLLGGLVFSNLGLASEGCLPISEDSFRELNGHCEALQARIDLIQQAQCSIDIAYYGIDTGDVPVALLELLRRAALRGVRVRLLVDGLRSRIPSDLQQYLQSNGVRIKLYHPKHKSRWLNRRLHSKLIVSDSSLAIIGSRNLRDEHFGLGEKKNYIDCDALVAGNVALHTQSYFDWLWKTPDVHMKCHDDASKLDVLKSHFSVGKCLGLSSDPWKQVQCPSDCQRLLNRAIERMVCRAGVELDCPRDWLADAVHGIKVDLLHDHKTNKAERRVQQGIVNMMDSAKRCILIESPYPAFHKEVRAAISRARRRGVKVTMLTNSLKSSDQLSVYAAYQNQKRSMLCEGVVLREQCGTGILHAKTIIVDHSKWMLGSYNFDARSDKLNLELMIVGCDPESAQRVRQTVEKRIAQSTKIKRGTVLLDVGRNPTAWKRTRMVFSRLVVEAYRGWL